MMIVELIEEGRMSAKDSDLTFSSCSDRSQGEVAVNNICCVSR